MIQSSRVVRLALAHIADRRTAAASTGSADHHPSQRRGRYIAPQDLPWPQFRRTFDQLRKIEPMTGHEPLGAPQATACYRHPKNPSGVRCQRCENFICSECMHQAAVGVHCPQCVSQTKQKVYTRDNLPGSRGLVTQTIIGINVLAFLAQMAFFGAGPSTSGTAGRDFSVWAPGVDNGEWWRILTSGFLHIGIIHLGMNMYSLYHLGPMLEKRLGPVRFTLAYLASLIGGSLGAMTLEPTSAALGASGAIFGLLGLLVVMFRSSGISINQSGLGPVLMINLFISLSGYVSLGGHAGGFLAGLGLGAMYFGTSPGAGPLFGRDQVKPDLATGAVIVALIIACLVVAANWRSLPF